MTALISHSQLGPTLNDPARPKTSAANSHRVFTEGKRIFHAVRASSENAVARGRGSKNQPPTNLFYVVACNRARFYRVIRSRLNINRERAPPNCSMQLSTARFAKNASRSGEGFFPRCWSASISVPLEKGRGLRRNWATSYYRKKTPRERRISESKGKPRRYVTFPRHLSRASCSVLHASLPDPIVGPFEISGGKRAMHVSRVL